MTVTFEFALVLMLGVLAGWILSARLAERRFEIERAGLEDENRKLNGKLLDLTAAHAALTAQSETARCEMKRLGEELEKVEIMAAQENHWKLPPGIDPDLVDWERLGVKKPA